jgi:hemerythrin-like domain-containing protein
MTDDVVDKIEHDHREVEELFAEFEASRDRAIALTICDELEIHTAAEEAEVYPVIAEEISDEMVDHAEDEHAEAKGLIAQIRGTTDADQLYQLVGQLKEAVQEHVQEEESEMLPKAREDLSDEQLEELGEKFDDAKDAAEPT